MDNLQQYIEQLEAQILQLEAKLTLLTKQKQEVLNAHKLALKEAEEKIADKYQNTPEPEDVSDSVFNSSINLSQATINQTLQQIYKI